MEEKQESSRQQLEIALSNPATAYEFVSRHGKNPQILPLLVQILVDPSYHLKNELRLQAVIMIRNAIDSWYRKISPHQIEPQQKIDLGRTLVDEILAKGESDPVIRKQVALCVGKIGKWNLDSNLSNLFDLLMAHVNNIFVNASWAHDPTTFQTLTGCLGAVYQIIQNMITNRSMRGQLALREVAQKHFIPIYSAYTSVFATWTTSLAQLNTLNLSTLFHSQTSIELSRVCIKILGQLATYAWKEPHREELPTTFVLQSVDRLVQVLTIRKKIIDMILLHKSITSKPSTAASIKSFFNPLNKHLFKYGKLFINIFEQDPQFLNITSLRELLTQTMWQVVEEGSRNGDYVNDDLWMGYLAPFPEKLVIQSLRILNQLTMSEPVSTSLSATQACELARILVTRLLPLRKHSLEFWAEDAESYDNEEIGLLDNVSFDVRSASANVIVRLSMMYPQELVGTILQLYNGLQSLDTNAPQSYMHMEAVSLAVGLVTTRLSSFPDPACTFNDWVKGRFMPLLCMTDSNGQILRRRIAWILGEFSCEEIDLETQQSIYLAINCLLENPSNDVATKLATCRSLKKTANWEPVEGHDHPMLAYLGNNIGHIAILFTLVENLDSQKVLTETLGLIIQTADTKIHPYATRLIEMMTTLWQQVNESPSKSNSASHLHNAILVTMITLVESLGSTSHTYHELICLLINHSSNPENPASVYLQEDGYILWLTTLRQATSLSPQLASMIPQAIKLARDANDQLPILLKILQSYLLLDCPTVISVFASDLSITLSELLKISAGVQPIKGIWKMIDYVLQCCPSAQWTAWFQQSDCFLELVQASIDKDRSPSSTVKYILQICRMITTDIHGFYAVLTHSTQQLPGTTSGPELLQHFCQACLDKIDYIGDAQDRKLLASALACLTSSPNGVITSHLDAFVASFSSVLAEGDETFDESTRTYRYAYDQEEVDEFDYVKLGLETHRLLQLRANDPVKSQTLVHIISSRLEQGGEELTMALNRVDPLLIDDLRQRLSGTLKG